MTSDLLWKKTEVDSLTADKAGLAAEIDALTRRLGDAEARMGQEVGGAQRELTSLKVRLCPAWTAPYVPIQARQPSHCVALGFFGVCTGGE